jgi:hypothetical protein
MCEATNQALAEAILKLRKPADPEVQLLIRQHYESVKAYWTPNKESYKGLATMYCEDSNFREYYESRGIKPVEFLAEAMNIFADRELE